jgi:hypothetical protein
MSSMRAVFNTTVPNTREGDTLCVSAVVTCAAELARAHMIGAQGRKGGYGLTGCATDAARHASDSVMG